MEAGENFAANVSVRLHCMLIIGSFYYLPLVVSYINKKIKDKKKKMLFFLSLIALYLVPLQQSNFIKNSFIWDLYEKYFSIKIVNGENIPRKLPGKCNIFGVVPHGIVPYSLGLLQFGKLNGLFGDLHITMASVVKYIPIFGQMLLLGGAVDTSFDNLQQLLKDKKNLGISPGGIGEMFYSDTSNVLRPGQGLSIYNETPAIYTQQSTSNFDSVVSVLKDIFVATKPRNDYVEYAVVKNRRGFIRLALLSGADIVPVYCFGSSQLFRELKMPFLEDISRYFKASLIAFYGDFYLPIPFKVPLVYAVGKAINVNFGRIDEQPSGEEVDFLLNTFINSIRLLFDDNKAAYGWADKVIKFI